MIIFLPISLNICFGCSKEPSHRDSCFEYRQHMFWLRNKKNKFLACTLIWRPDATFSAYRVPNGLLTLHGCLNFTQSSVASRSSIEFIMWAKKNVDPDQLASSEAS